MNTFRDVGLALLFALPFLFSAADTQEMNLLPKVGLQPGNEAMKAADAEFLANIDRLISPNFS